MNTWHRIHGPDNVTPDTSGADNIRGDYGWQSVYACGKARAEVTYFLVVQDMGEEWSEDNRACVEETVYTYVVGDDDEHDAEDIAYEYVGLHDYALGDSERAHDYLDREGNRDLSEYMYEPPADGVVPSGHKYPLNEWVAAMFESPLDIVV